MITEYHTLIAGLIGGTGLGLLVGCVLGWILGRWKQEGDELVREALEEQSRETILVDRDELLTLCNRAADAPYGDLHALKRRARQMLEKIGETLR